MTLALVTGASSGIGESFARCLAARGDDLVIVARRQARLESVAAELEATHGRRVVPVVADLGTEEGRERVWQATSNLTVPVDLLVNNAGFGLAGQLASSSRRRLLEMVAINVTAVLDLTHRYVEGMVHRGHGDIINVSSLAAFQPVPYLGSYAATKSFVLSLTESLAEELADTGVRVLALCPGPVPTEFQEIAGTSIKGPMRHLLATSDDCVEAALAGLEAGHVIVVPGLPHRLLAATVGVFPRRAVTRVAGALYRRRMRQR